ncbi:hypothetical protein CK203_094636 [Vitis vinifera]|uniref:Uncharacterized protein n=1 Tax=Vitis vinifera TaxID=29760 RepID=A0A438CL12_VITVI|nr:hypothetical protein CK203_094636 [Vitis vinifera]
MQSQDYAIQVTDPKPEEIKLDNERISSQMKIIKYDFVVSVITSRVESHSLKDVQGLLLAQEIELSSIW